MRKFDMNISQTCPPHLSYVAILPWEIQKKSFFSTLLFIYTSNYLRYLSKKTNSNCCTAALAVYLLLFSASYYMHSPSTASGAATKKAERMWTCWGLRQRLVATWAEFQHSMVYYATDQCWKRQEACINAERGHSEHLLWHCLPDIPVATHHNRFFSEQPTTTHNWLFSEPPTPERMQQTFSQMKQFCNSQVIVMTFSGGVGKWITDCLSLIHIWRCRRRG